MAPGTSKLGVAERVGIRSRLPRDCARSYRGGQPPRTLPMKGTYPLHNPCSNPTLSLRFCCDGCWYTTQVEHDHLLVCGEGGIRTYGRVAPTAVFETKRS